MSQSVLDLVRAKREKIDKDRASNVPMLRPAQGKHKYRLLPGWRQGDGTFFHDFGLHYIKKVDPATNKMVTETVYVCTEKTFGRPCDVCDAISMGIRAASDDGVTALLKEAKASQKYLLNVLHLTGDKPDKAQLFEIGPKLFDQLLEIMQEHGDITDPKTGKDLIITRSGSGLDTTYTMTVAANSAPLKSVPELVNIDAVVSQESPAGLQKAIAGVMRAQGRTPPAALAATASVAPALAHAVVDDGPDAFEEAPARAAPLASADEDELDSLLEGI